MKTLLYIGAAGNQLWCKYASGWQAVDSVDSVATWVVTDLAEEAFVPLQVPRLLGRDRTDFVQRQLASQFPDTPYRVALPSTRKTRWLDWLAPTQQTLLGVDAAARVDAALTPLRVPLAGVWSTSGLLAQWAQQHTGASDYFAVMPTPGRLRIVYVAMGQPVLTRLVSGPQPASDQAAEIVRTLRHLENTRVVQRNDQRLPVLVLGDATALLDLLAAQRLDVVYAVPAGAAPVDPHTLLFDRALLAPPGQLAPVERRVAYLARGMRRIAYGVATLALVLALSGVGVQLGSLLNAQESLGRVQTQAQQVLAQSAQVDQVLGRWVVAPERVHEALDLDAREVARAPTLNQVVGAVAAVVSRQPQLRAQHLEWRVLTREQRACASDSRAVTVIPPASTTAPTQALVAELQLDVSGWGEVGPRERERLMRQVTAGFKALPQLDVVTDPIEVLMQGKLESSEQRAADVVSHWCLRWTVAHRQDSGGAP